MCVDFCRLNSFQGALEFRGETFRDDQLNPYLVNSPMVFAGLVGESKLIASGMSNF